jgi:hypothetical protein
MNVLNIGNTAIVLERVVAIQCDEAFSGDEAIRVFLAGLAVPIELFVEDPEKTYLELCASLSRLQRQIIEMD